MADHDKAMRENDLQYKLEFGEVNLEEVGIKTKLIDELKKYSHSYKNTVSLKYITDVFNLPCLTKIEKMA